jgi:hypothetical protein
MRVPSELRPTLTGWPFFLPKALTDCLQTGMFGSGASERLNVLDQTFRSAICSRQNYQIRCGSHRIGSETMSLHGLQKITY